MNKKLASIIQAIKENQSNQSIIDQYDKIKGNLFLAYKTLLNHYRIETK